jgi:hypothetical protein
MLKFEGNYWSANDNDPGDRDNNASVLIGKKANSVGTGLGIALTNAMPQVLEINGNDGGAALTAAAYQLTKSRMLLTAAQSGDLSVFGLQGHLKNYGASDTSTGNKAGVWAYYEATSGATVAANSCAIMASIDVPSGATIGGSVGAVQCSGNLGGTHTGKAGCLHIPNPAAGTWDFFAIFGSTTGATAAGGAGTCTLSGGWVKLPILVNATTYYIPAAVTLTNS